jgi:PAS domain S-box-containing protein
MSRGKSKAQLELELKQAESQITALEQQVQELKARVEGANHVPYQQSAQKLSKLLELLPVGISILDENRLVVFQNSALLKILDFNIDDLQKGAYTKRQYMDGNELPMPADGFASNQAEKQGTAVYNVETGVIKENGETIWTNVSAVPVNFEDWKTVIVTADITGHKRAEKALRESEEKYAALFENAAVPAALTKMPEGVFDDVNQAFQSVYGYTREEVAGKTSVEIGMALPAERIQAYRGLEELGLGTLQDNERHLRTKEGEARVGLINVNKVVISGQDYAITTIHDVTERKRAEEALQTAYQRFHIILSSLYGGILLVNNDSQVEFANEAFCNLFDLNESPEKLIGFSAPEMIIKISAAYADPTAAVTRIREILAGGQPVRGEELAMARGRTYMRDFIPIVLNGKQYGRLWNHIDITERKRAEEALRQSEENFSKAFKSSPAALLITRLADGKFLELNDAYTAIVGYEHQELLGRHTKDFNIYIHPSDRQAIVEQLQRRGSVRDFETSIRHRSGSIRHVIANQELLTFNNEACILTHLLDITQRKRAEENVRRFQLLAAHSRDIILFMRRESGRILEANSAAEQAYGYSRDEILELAIRDLRAPDTMGLTSEQMAQADAAGILFETVHRRKDGSTFPVEVSSQGATVDGVRTLVSVVRDITERKQMEQKLRESEHKYSLLFDKLSVPTVVFQLPEGIITNVNEASEKLNGFTRQEQVGKTTTELGLVKPEDREMILTLLKRDGGIVNQEICITTGAGEIRFIMLNATVLTMDGSLHVITTWQDITDRKRAELALQKSEMRFSTIFENSPIAIGISRVSDRKIILANEALLHLYGYSREETIGRTTAELGIWANIEEQQHFIEALQTGHKVQGMEAVARQISGEERHVLIWGELFEISDELCLVAQIVDITEWRHAEQNLKESEERFSIAFHASPVAQAITLTSAGELLVVNDAYCRLFEYSREELVGKSTIDLRLWENPADRQAALEELLTTGHIHLQEINIRTQSGEIRTALTSIEPISWKGLPCVISSVIDITDRKQMEDDLRRSNAELEQFAYVASHDLQEPLRAVAGMVQLLQRRYQGQLDERADEYIHHAVEAADRMQSLINDLLAFSRVGRRSNPIEPVESKICLGVALRNLAVAIHESNALITADALPVVRADSTQLVQLFQNLIANGIKFQSRKEPQIHISAKLVKDAWLFSVQDNGIGIEPQYFERIFLVFQRLHTRREYPGTGIGLAICKKIVERHGGSIWVESMPGVGSTFYFTLPVREDE